MQAFEIVPKLLSTESDHQEKGSLVRMKSGWAETVPQGSNYLGASSGLSWPTGESKARILSVVKFSTPADDKFAAYLEPGLRAGLLFDSIHAEATHGLLVFLGLVDFLLSVDHEVSHGT